MRTAAGTCVTEREREKKKDDFPERTCVRPLHQAKRNVTSIALIGGPSGMEEKQ